MVLPQRLVLIDTAMLCMIIGTKQSSWTVEISLNNHPIQFKLEMGAEVTAVSDKVFSSLPILNCRKRQKFYWD